MSGVASGLLPGSLYECCEAGREIGLVLWLVLLCLCHGELALVVVAEDLDEEGLLV